MNYALFEEGLKNERTTYARHLLKKNGGQILSSDEQKTASLLCKPPSRPVSSDWTGRP